MLASNQHPTSSQPHQFTSNIRRILTFSCRSFDQSPTFLQRCIGNIQTTSKSNSKLTLLFSCFYVMLASNQHSTSSQPHQFTSNIRRILTFSCRSFDQSPTFLQRCIGNIQTTSKSNSKLTLLFSCFYVMLASNQHSTSSQPHQFTSNIRRILTFSCRSFDQSPTFLQRCIGNIQTTSKSNSKLTLLFSCFYVMLASNQHPK